MSRALQRFQFDRAYVERLAAGDPETARHFTDYFSGLLSLKLRSRLRSPALVEDAKQETFVRVLAALRRQDGLQSPGALGSFVNSVCNNVLFELYRTQTRTGSLEDEVPQEVQDGAPGADIVLAAIEERTHVRHVIDALPEKERQLLRWLFFDELDKDEICRRLNVDRGYLRVLLHRAKLRFREEYAGG